MYWLILIPLVVVAVAIVVVPVLYGTLKHEHWERHEATLKERQRSGEVIDSVDAPRVHQSDLHLALQQRAREAGPSSSGSNTSKASAGTPSARARQMRPSR